MCYQSDSVVGRTLCERTLHLQSDRKSETDDQRMLNIGPDNHSGYTVDPHLPSSVLFSLRVVLHVYDIIFKRPLRA